MATIIDRLREVNRIYKTSVNLDQLNGAKSKLQGIIIDKYIDDNNKHNGLALLCRLNAKIGAIAYFDGGYLEEDYSSLCAILETNLKTAVENGYTKTIKIITDLSALSEKVHQSMLNADSDLAFLEDESGECVATRQTLEETYARFQTRLQNLEECPLSGKPFEDDVVIFDILVQAKTDIENAMKNIERNINIQKSQQVKTFLVTDCQPIDKEEFGQIFDHHPALPSVEASMANLLVLCTPHRDEAVLYVRAFKKERNIDFYVVSAERLYGKDQIFFEALSLYLTSNKQGLLIFGMENYANQNDDSFLKDLLGLAKKEIYVFAVDSKGDRRVYERFYFLAKNDVTIGANEVYYKYLTMPPFKEVSKTFEENGMIKEGDYVALKKDMAFMGYEGYNLALKLHSEGRPWESSVIRISQIHQAESLTYVRLIPSQTQYIDSGWVNLELENKVTVRRAFDYDEIKVASPENIKKIINFNANLFAKCGVIVKYCTLAGEDPTTWKNLTVEEKSERLSDATALVAYMLNTENAPEVKVVKDDEWTVKGAGGLCCDGGKRILYKESCCDDYDWTIDAVCHECFHAFQHTAEMNGFQEWYFADLGVTKNRIEEWTYNFSNYVSIDKNKKNYMIQMVEGDARAFAKDCIDQSSTIWNLINFD